MVNQFQKNERVFTIYYFTNKKRFQDKLYKSYLLISYFFIIYNNFFSLLKSLFKELVHNLYYGKNFSLLS